MASEKSYHCEVKSFCDDETFLLPRFLPQEYVASCKVMANRAELIRQLPKGGVVAEIGTQKGEFAHTISQIATPDQLHLFDLDFSKFDRTQFTEEEMHRIFINEGDSSTLLSKFPKHYFDWIYIDGDHSFDGVSKDIKQAKKKIKPGGYLVFNDYTIYSPFEKMQYGVMRAVNHLCLAHNYEICFFALDICDYPDVAVRKRTKGGEPALDTLVWPILDPEVIRPVSLTSLSATEIAQIDIWG